MQDFRTIRQPILTEGEKNEEEQAGAELCQAQEKLWNAKPALHSKKLSHYQQQIRSSSIFH